MDTLLDLGDVLSPQLLLLRDVGRRVAENDETRGQMKAERRTRGVTLVSTLHSQEKPRDEVWCPWLYSIAVIPATDFTLATKRATQHRDPTW